MVVQEPDVLAADVGKKSCFYYVPHLICVTVSFGVTLPILDDISPWLADPFQTCKDI